MLAGNQCWSTCELHSEQPEFTTCAADCLIPSSIWDNVPKLLFSIFLICCSGGFSGLTLGLLSLSIEGLDIVIHGGTTQEKRWAERILPVRRRGNLLLCTLLLGNTLVNALIAILMADLTSGVVGGLISTAVIVVFGEITPQAICNRHGLRIGSASIPIVRLLMILLIPITYPIATILDMVLGREMGTAYTRQQLDKLLEMEMANQAISTDDQQLLSSALKFSAKVCTTCGPPTPCCALHAPSWHAPRAGPCPRFTRRSSLISDLNTRLDVWHFALWGAHAC